MKTSFVSGESDRLLDGAQGKISIQYLKSVLDSAQEAIVIVQDERYKYVNKRASEIDGRPAEAFIGRHIREMSHPEDYPQVIKSYYWKLKGLPGRKYRYRHINQKGDVVWIELMGTFILWEGRPAVMNFVTDITDQVEAEEEIKKTERILRDIFNFLPDPTFAVDTQGKIISWNREMEKLVGKKAEKMIGKGNYEYSIPFYGKRIPMLIDFILKPDAEREKEFRYFKREGNLLYGEQEFRLNDEIRSIWGKASLIYDHRDQVIGAIETMRDITEFRNAVVELKNKSLHLEETNTALRVLLEHRQNDRREMEESIAANFRTLIDPYLKKLRNVCKESRQRTYLDILEDHLDKITAPFLMNIKTRYPNLTPREIQVADLVKEGKTAKEIASILGISLHTANNYRKRLRKKFLLESKNQNLRAHLLTFN